MGFKRVINNYLVNQLFNIQVFKIVINKSTMLIKPSNHKIKINIFVIPKRKIDD